MSDRFSQGTIAKKLQCCVAFNGRVSELLKLFNRKCIPTRKTDFWTKITKNNWPLPSCRFSCPVNMGAQSLCKMQKIGLLQPIPWWIDTKKSLPSRSPKLIVFPLPPPDQKPLALKARPAVYVIGFHPLHMKGTRVSWLFWGCPSPTALCCAVESHLFPLFTKVLFFTLFFRHETKTLK